MSEMPNSPDSSLRPAGNGDAARGDRTEGPGRQIDAVAEAAETEQDALREVSRLLERAPPAARKKREPGPAPSAPQLPMECVGLACLVRTRLQQLAERCRDDQACWRAAVGVKKNTGGENEQTPPAP